MATKTIYLTGTCKWAQLIEPDGKFKKWGLDLYPDDASWTVYHNSGLELKEREDEDGGKFIKVGRPQMKIVKGEMVEFEGPELLMADGTKLGTRLVGNGSDVTCKVVVYDTVKGKGHRLEAVRVNTLKEYIKPEVDLSNEEDPF